MAGILMHSRDISIKTGSPGGVWLEETYRAKQLQTGPCSQISCSQKLIDEEELSVRYKWPNLFILVLRSVQIEDT